jgi:hypothetical protein
MREGAVDPKVLIVCAIIVAAGLVGGYGAHLSEQQPSGDHSSTRLKRYLMLGVIAAATVPLFLSLVRSSIMRDIFVKTLDPQGQPYPPNYESYLIFLGIALIAAFSARNFIDSISKQVLRQLEEVQQTARGAAATAADAKETAREAVDEVESADDQAGVPLPAEAAEETALDGAFGGAPPTITAVERSALEALSHRTYRTRTGIAEDAGIARSRISEVLEELYRKKLAVPTKSPTTGGARWVITKRGMTALQPQQ